MKIVSAVGSFKGSIDSVLINQVIASALGKLGHDVTPLPVADGGDGLLDAILWAKNGQRLSVNSINALGIPTSVDVGIADTIGVAEMALASGLAMLGDNLDPANASTYGTGLLIRELVRHGAQEIILGLGGSATNDGGMGCLAALGYRFLDKNGTELAPVAKNLIAVAGIDDTAVAADIRQIPIHVACDVNNPLLGPQGATYVYGPQKGVLGDLLPTLESGMAHFAEVVVSHTGKDYREIEGAGAAGGLGYGLLSFLNAHLEKGAEIVLRLADYVHHLQGADLVITGEGRIDNQTVFGKLPQVVADGAKQRSIPCVAICGSSIADQDALNCMGIRNVIQLVDHAPLEECMHQTESLVSRLAPLLVK